MMLFVCLGLYKVNKMTRREFMGLFPITFIAAILPITIKHIENRPVSKKRYMRRKSVRKDDIGYDPFAYKWNVEFNGKPLKHCFTADEWLGEAWVYDVENSFYPFFDLAEKKLIGDVKLIPPNN